MRARRREDSKFGHHAKHTFSSGHGFSRADTRARRAALAAEGTSTPSRHGAIAGTYFVTSRTWESRKLFVTEPMCQLFVDTLVRYQQAEAFALHAFVLMPDRFHILLTPAPDKTLERAVQVIKGGSAHTLGKEPHLRFPVWQRGFSDHRIRDAVDYDVHGRYIEQNPVRGHLVGEAKEYRWSSATGAFEHDPTPQGLKPAERVASRHG
jgi:putative transposase